MNSDFFLSHNLLKNYQKVEQSIVGNARGACDACRVMREMKLFLRVKLRAAVLCTYFLIIHTLFVQGEGTVGSLYWYFFISPDSRKEQKIINFCLQFLKNNFSPSLLVFPLWDFALVYLCSRINKARNIFFTGRDFGFPEMRKKPLRAELLLHWREGVWQREFALLAGGWEQTK